jgi:hypothetical protein
MKDRIKRSALVAAALGATLAALPAQSFEGIVTMSMASATLKSEAIGYMKAQGFKILPKTETGVEVNGVTGGYPIIDFKAQKFYIVSPKDKYYMTLPLGQLTAPIDKVAVKIKKSGKSDSILGHKVEEWVLDDPASKAQAGIWATADFKPGFNFFISLQKTSPVEGLLLGRMAKSLVAQGLFPLGAWAKDASGATAVEMRILSIEAGKVADSELAVPEGYGKMSDALKKKK